MNKAIYIAFIFLGISCAIGQQVLRLAPQSVYPQWITLSGFSSGGSFAQQFQISYSSLFSGIAVFSHTFYRCGPPTGVQEDYDRVCTKLGNLSDPLLYNTSNVLGDIQDYYDRNLIDNPINIRNKRLYVFAGTRNELFTTDMSLRIMNVYEPLIQNTESVYTRVMEAQLLFPTANFGRPCQEEAGTPNLFLGNCGISGAYEALQFLLGDVVKKPPKEAGRVPLQPLQMFDQTEFFRGINGRVDMDDVGFMYIPTNCYQIRCLLHFYFHGCLTGREFNGTAHIENSGYLEVAELSNIIMVFPQAISSVENDIGCWDTYGFTGLLYATQRGAQVSVMRNILARVLGEDTPRGDRIRFPTSGISSNDLAPIQSPIGFTSISSSALPSESSTSRVVPPNRENPVLNNDQHSLQLLPEPNALVADSYYLPPDVPVDSRYRTYPAREYRVVRNQQAGSYYSQPFTNPPALSYAYQTRYGQQK